MNRVISSAIAATLVSGCLLLSGCWPLYAGGAAMGALTLSDRRTVGSQTEDQAIELKAGNRLREALPDERGISVTSYNRKVLLSGPVSTDEVRRQAETTVARIDNVRTVHNELNVGFRPALSTRTNDSATTARVKAAFVEAKELQANTIKVVTESGTVFLMGLVTQREGDRAAQVAARLAGVQRVVTVFEYVTDEELARMSGR